MRRRECHEYVVSPLVGCGVKCNGIDVHGYCTPSLRL
jgi:hypothetical protein